MQQLAESEGGMIVFDEGHEVLGTTLSILVRPPPEWQGSPESFLEYLQSRFQATISHNN